MANISSRLLCNCRELFEHLLWPIRGPRLESAAFLVHQAGTIHESIHRNRETSHDLFHILPSGCYDRKCSRDLVSVQA
jgi:hypothetical protein